MRTGSIAFRAAGVAAVLVMTPATAAFAGSSVKATVSPAAIAPGGVVEIRVVGCRDRSGGAWSDAFAKEAALVAKGEDGWLVGKAKVSPDAKPGSYGITVRCDMREHRGAGSVDVTRHHSRPHQPDPAPTKTSRHDEPGAPHPPEPHPSAPQTHASPVAPVQAGGGGTAVLAAPVSTVDADETGPSTSQTVTGLVLAGVAAIAVAVRSSRRRRRTGTD
ncbi:hypothetical protein [Streptomyces peucetius]|uniref:Gram-positive cocci surface proteins LPxTG domain-containing protein n=1 Tax=Streptomyces peucetius TaxID=1950 RepID=A0ABY6I5L6_STRPE|nr:hypothetical protein [Streptomyces peucetius]UYQ62291.1 hypothetical protein OGH68_12915 [Streptomyces peucetius]